MAGKHPDVPSERAYHADDAEDAAERVDIAKANAELPARPLNNPVLTSTTILIIAGVALAIIVAALYFSLAG